MLRLAKLRTRRDHPTMFSTATKVWLFLIVLCFVFLFLGERWAGRTGLLIGFALALGVNVLIFFLGESRILANLQARGLKGHDSWGLKDRIERLCHVLGLKVPHLYLMDNATATLFSLSFATRKPSLCVSTALLQKLSNEELDAVLTQQLYHLSRMASFGFGVSSVLANTLMGVGQFLDTLWPPNFFLDRKQKPFLTLLSPLGWLIVRLSINRGTYFENDRAAAELLQNRELLGETLWRLEGLAQARPLAIPPCTSHLFIVNPEGLRQRNFFLRSHPPLADRLRRLTGRPTA